MCIQEREAMENLKSNAPDIIKAEKKMWILIVQKDAILLQRLNNKESCLGFAKCFNNQHSHQLIS